MFLLRVLSSKRTSIIYITFWLHSVTRNHLLMIIDIGYFGSRAQTSSAQQSSDIIIQILDMDIAIIILEFRKYMKKVIALLACMMWMSAQNKFCFVKFVLNQERILNKIHNTCADFEHNWFYLRSSTAHF